MSLVKPEYGPTLPQIMAPLPRIARLAAAVLAAVLAVGAAALAVKSSDPVTEVLITEPVTYNLTYEPGLRRLSVPGASLALERRRGSLFLDSYVVRTLTLPAYRGAASGELPVYAFGYIRGLRRSNRRFELIAEGRTRINNGIGYQIVFRSKRGVRTIYDRRLLLVPDEPAGLRRGVVLELTSTPSGTAGGVTTTGNSGALKTPLRSFRFGRERKGGEA